MSYRAALYRVAQAHEHAAGAHQRAARMTKDATHEQMITFHLAAADRRRADQIQALRHGSPSQHATGPGT
jgi:hypothetical protein